MDKQRIKEILRESLKLAETNGQPTPSPIKGKPKNFKKEYADIQGALADSIVTKSGVMAAAGLGDPTDAGDRRAFNAKLDRDENENGSIRQFDDKELASVAKVVSNPKAYLHTKMKKQN